MGTCIKRGNGIAGEDSGYRLGNIFIAYYPLHNESGEVVGALGIEVAADRSRGGT